VKNLSAEKEQGQEDHDDRGACENGPPQAFTDAQVHQVSEIRLAGFLQVLTNPVKDDDRIVDGEAGDGQQSRDDVEVNLFVG